MIRLLMYTLIGLGEVRPVSNDRQFGWLVQRYSYPTRGVGIQSFDAIHH